MLLGRLVKRLYGSPAPRSTGGARLWHFELATFEQISNWSVVKGFDASEEVLQLLNFARGRL